MFIETNQIKLDFNMAYGNCKDLPRRTIANKTLQNKDTNQLLKNWKTEKYIHVLYTLFWGCWFS